MVRQFLFCEICKRSVQVQVDQVEHIKKLKNPHTCFICSTCQAKIYYEAKQFLK